MGSLIVLFLMSVIAASINAGEYCVTERHQIGWLYTYEYEYCDYGCCDTYPNHTCCPGLAVWAIVVIVIGSIIFLSCIVAVICTFMKKKGRSGMVVQPQGQIAMISSPGYGQPGMQPQPYYQQGGPGYGQPDMHPPPYYQQGIQQQPTYTNPAFPPPPANYS